ncbi:hypothetical protein EQZ23_07725 [Sphingomonas sp. UV9]|uniref:hypothetical protein n=1 Tax=Sphingomonas sp. UV9 TaxID=1851410 RepID=UPI000FFC04A9|nr:hypothetical protein [Sphingomonas sp. UV9]RXD05009.1 hypothetical protein EQZ23_07725 [Sphingomonas sp. UV9]
MMTIKFIAATALTLMTALSPERATAQMRTSKQLADQWRDARRTELLEQREQARAELSKREALLSSELKALDWDSTPDSIAATAQSDTVSNETDTTTLVALVSAPNGSSQTATSTGTEVFQPQSGKRVLPVPVATDLTTEGPAALPWGKAIPATGSVQVAAAPVALDPVVASALTAALAPPKQTFGGLDLGAGLSFTLDLGKLNRISRASAVNGIVRSDDQDNGRARIMLESHYFFTPCTWNFLGLKNPCKAKDGWQVADPKEARWGLGPFIAVQPGSDNIIDAIGMGIMVGARREQSAQSFNLGIGIVFDPNTRVLGDGIIENQPLPIGEIEVRYRETLQTGILVLTSFSF